MDQSAGPGQIDVQQLLLCQFRVFFRELVGLCEVEVHDVGKVVCVLNHPLLVSVFLGLFNRFLDFGLFGLRFLLFNL